MEQKALKKLERTETLTAVAGLLLAFWQEIAQSHQGEWIILAGLCLTCAVLDGVVGIVVKNQDPSKANPAVFPLLIFMLALLILFPLLTATTAVRYYKADDNVAYKLRRGGASVADVYGADETVILKDEYKGVPVTVLDKSALSYRKAAKKVVLPAQLEKIGDNAFASCDSLEELTLPDSVTSIGKNAFARCRSLEELVLPDGVTGIGKNALGQCKNLRRITIPASVTKIPRDAFKGCPKDMVIVGVPGSAAQTFAEKYYTFEPLTS